MTLEEFLRSIRPDLTAYGVLLTFAVISFVAGKHFWKYEQELVAENLDRLRDLIQNFRSRHIEPVLRQELDGAISAAYEVAINGLIADLHPKDRTTAEEVSRRELSLEELRVRLKELSDIVSEAALEARLRKLKSGSTAEGFIESASGQRIFDRLDAAYTRLADVSRRYQRACGACAGASYAFLALFLVLIIGLLRSLWAWPDLILHLWLFAGVGLFLLGIVYFVRLEFNRRGLLRLWEEFQIYGRI